MKHVVAGPMWLRRIACVLSSKQDSESSREAKNEDEAQIRSSKLTEITCNLHLRSRMNCINID